ncbi:MAG: DUF951 domain-containing protein [Desulfitobacteriia bacterium]
MELNIGDLVRMRKKHPCGNQDFRIVRTGADFRIECLKCGHQAWIARPKLERNVKEKLSGNYLKD